MVSFRLSLALSLVVHGAALGTVCALGTGAPRASRTLHIELRPSEDARAVIADAPPPREVVEWEDADELPPLQEPEEPAAAPVTSADFAPAVAAEFVPVAVTDPMPDWRAAVARVRPATTAPVVPAPVAPEVVPPSPLRPAPSALVLEVIPGENAPPEYPWLARRRGWQGVTAVFVRVGGDGRVSDAAVARSSGHQVLDAAALQAVRGWRFRGGPGETTVEFEFVLRAKWGRGRV